jgi:drug/metabolite transporter (DMT)-like permease
VYNSVLAALVYFTGSLINLLIAVDNGQTPIPILMQGRLLIAGVAIITGVLASQRNVTILRFSSAYLLQSLARYAALWLIYYGYSTLPIQIVIIIGFTQPFFTVALSALMRNDGLSGAELGWLTFGCMCACTTVAQSSDAAICAISICAMIASNILAAIITITSKELIERDGAIQSTTTITTTTTIITLLHMAYNKNQLSAYLYTSHSVYTLAGLGVVGALHTLLLQLALSRSSPSFVTSFQYVKIPLAMLFDKMIMGKALVLWTIPGALGIVLAITKFTQHHNKRQSQSPA